ncbi:amino acid adenylation domain-containing protein [Cronbergia sp. UHCC 0137]|uniref:amino acid adenylation domain-containing protein n=1 Tax=Cronbergia sp. UHCC 0137 TaxID=3110239 RepID=UPI002B1F22C4|nr:amino acid adenylation domain-containing protein [Cronbergia sp. UHCC 0137]MEA5617546.1 amino acid adenylation domain-containing protein [Cronbergia sp. UHCC 0137]
MNTNLNRQNIEDIYPLSPLQQGMLFHSLYAPDSGAYVVQVSYELHGNLNIPAFEAAWQYLINRHSVLRTAFVWDKLEKPLQVVGKQVKFQITHLDWCDFTIHKQQESLKVILQKQREQGFNLSQAPLIRMILIQLKSEVYQFVWSYHHLLLDGWSVQVLLKEFIVIYQAYIQQQTPVLFNSRRYRDYIAWLQQQNLAEAEVFWKQQLQGFVSPTRLNVDQNIDVRPDNLHSHYREENIQLSVELTTKLQTLAKQQQLTINTFIQGAWALLLSRYSGEKDVLFAIVSAGRPSSLNGANTMVGLFINTLPFRVLVSSEETLYQWLQKLQNQQVEIRQYEYSSLVDIHRWSEVSPSIPLFETLVVFENYPIEPALKQSLESLEIRNIQGSEQTNYPLTLYAVVDSQLSLRILYDRDRYHNTTITQILEQLETLLLGMTQGNCTLSALPFLSPTQQQILIDWNATTQEISHQCVHEIISQQAQQTPDATAVVFADKILTYAELNAKSNQIAHYLLQLGIKAEDRIGVCLERSSPLLIIALLGILKAGAAYIPLDPTFPPERLRFMMADAELRLLLAQASLANIITDKIATINLDELEEKINQQPIFDPQIKVTPEQLTYLIYTSGSTGQPKGVMIEGRSLVNILTDLKQRLSITPNDKLLAVTTIAFDIAALELFLPLITGAQVVLPPQTLDPSQLATCIEQHQITIMQATPATWRLLLASGWEGKQDLKILCGGEALDNTLAQQLLSCTQEVWNLYGPTETTIWSAAKKLSIDEPVTIGHPIANTQFYILDEHLQPVPIGVPGELYIGGYGVARGYWKRPDLTAERFLLKTPLCVSAPLREKTLYKTGDRVRYLEGKLEYLGRLDYQIKIRGFRIELGEIEAVITQHPQVEQAVVTLREDEPGEQRLVAYIVSHPEIIQTELRAFLGEKLPIYMMPSAFILLEKFPLTPNGKIDRKALPKPNNLHLAITDNFLPPQTKIEQAIADIWQQILAIENISIHDNFFDLGGHSLLIVRMQGQLHLKLNQNIPLVDLFRYPTINSLAKYLTQNTPPPDKEIEHRISQQQTGKQRLLQQRKSRLKN